MKILHTADWHAGRTLHGIDRTPEVREVLREIADIAKMQSVDLIVVAGDVYDSKTSSAEAEAAIYEFFMDVGQAGIPSVVIAGNHDSPARLDAVAPLLQLSQVRVLGHPRVAGAGGVFDLPVAKGTARIAALPFISERRIVKVADLLGDVGQRLETYQARMRKLVENLSASFTADTVNLLLMHGTMEGATLAHSEYQFHCTDAYVMSADIIPSGTSYVALGHIHKPQAIQNYPEHAGRYAGSILQLDFGEEGDAKSVTIVNAQPGRPSEIESLIPLKAGKRLKHVRADLQSVERKLEHERSFEGYIKLRLKLEASQPGLKDRLLRDYPNLISVELNLTADQEVAAAQLDLKQLNMLETYAQYYQEKRGQVLPVQLQDAFSELLSLHEEEL